MSIESSLAPFSRRNWLKSLALASLANPKLFASPAAHFAPRAKRIIWLTQAGAPSQLDLFDYKPGLTTHRVRQILVELGGEPRLVIKEVELRRRTRLREPDDAFRPRRKVGRGRGEEFRICERSQREALEPVAT